MERLVQEQRDLALPNAKRGGDGGDADNGNRGGGNKRAPCTSLTTSPLAVRGAVSTALDGIWIEVFTIFLSTEIKPETPATRMQPLVGSD